MKDFTDYIYLTFDQNKISICKTTLWQQEYRIGHPLLLGTGHFIFYQFPLKNLARKIIYVAILLKNQYHGITILIINVE